MAVLSALGKAQFLGSNGQLFQPFPVTLAKKFVAFDVATLSLGCTSRIIYEDR